MDTWTSDEILKSEFLLYKNQFLLLNWLASDVIIASFLL